MHSGLQPPPPPLLLLLLPPPPQLPVKQMPLPLKVALGSIHCTRWIAKRCHVGSMNSASK